MHRYLVCDSHAIQIFQMQSHLSLSCQANLNEISVAFTNQNTENSISNR